MYMYTDNTFDTLLTKTRISASRLYCMTLPTSQVTFYMHVYTESYSNYFIHESKWTFMADEIYSTL